MLEQEAELFERLTVAPEHKAAGGVAIEPMRESGVARQAEAEGSEIILKIFAALRPAMNRDSGGLVDHQHHRVAIKKSREELLLPSVWGQPARASATTTSRAI